MDKRLVAVLLVATVGASVATTHNLTKADELSCALTANEARAEDDYCAAWIVDGNVTVGPLSDAPMNVHFVGE